MTNSLFFNSLSLTVPILRQVFSSVSLLPDKTILCMEIEVLAFAPLYERFQIGQGYSAEAISFTLLLHGYSLFSVNLALMSAGV